MAHADQVGLGRFRILWSLGAESGVIAGEPAAGPQPSGAVINLVLGIDKQARRLSAGQVDDPPDAARVVSHSLVRRR